MINLIRDILPYRHPQEKTSTNIDAHFLFFIHPNSSQRINVKPPDQSLALLALIFILFSSLGQSSFQGKE